MLKPEEKSGMAENFLTLSPLVGHWVIRSLGHWFFVMGPFTGKAN